MHKLLSLIDSWLKLD